jgi:phosphate transport system ATP-binding protein
LKSFNRLIELQDGITVTGQVLVDGEDIYDPNVELMHLRKKMGLLFQKPQVLPMSVYENVAYGPRIHGVRNKKKLNEVVERYIQEAGLWNEVKDILHKPALSLSGGQQQRLCIARTLAVKPSIILMDEPASALDPISTAKIEELIAELKESYTIVIVTHNMHQAARVSDKTAFFYLGELIEYEKTKELFTNPKNKQTENYITGRFG